MSKYRVLEPVTYVKGNKVIMHKKPVELANIDDSTAAKLGDAVQKHGGQDDDSKSAPQPQKATQSKASGDK
jgi:hypothetical protein